MAYNLVGEFNSIINWEDVNSKLIPKTRSNVEFIPGPGMGLSGEDSIFISIQRIDQKSGIDHYVNEVKQVVEILLDLDFKIFDLYLGILVDKTNLNELINRLIK